MKLQKSLIYGLLASIFMVSAPHAAHLPPWVVAFSVSLLGWRTYLNFSGHPSLTFASIFEDKTIRSGETAFVARSAGGGETHAIAQRWLADGRDGLAAGGAVVQARGLCAQRRWSST